MLNPDEQYEQRITAQPIQNKLIRGGTDEYERHIASHGVKASETDTWRSRNNNQPMTVTRRIRNSAK